MTPNEQKMAQATLDECRQLITGLVATARAAQSTLSLSSHADRRAALSHSAALIRAHSGDIISHNAADLARAAENGITAAFTDRLTLTAERIEAVAKGLEDIVVDQPQ